MLKFRCDEHNVTYIAESFDQRMQELLDEYKDVPGWRLENLPPSEALKTELQWQDMKIETEVYRHLEKFAKQQGIPVSMLATDMLKPMLYMAELFASPKEVHDYNTRERQRTRHWLEEQIEQKMKGRQ